MDISGEPITSHSKVTGEFSTACGDFSGLTNSGARPCGFPAIQR